MKPADFNYYYKLVDNVPVPCSREEGFAEFEKERHVAQINLPGGVFVSTVFLVINHAFDDGPPVLFETMIFGGKHDQYCERYVTWDEAVEGHKKAIELVVAGFKIEEDDSN